jgi:hypothetical protein
MAMLLMAVVPFTTLIATAADPSGAARVSPAGAAEALALADAVFQAMGGDSGWRAARFFRFDFVVEKEGKVLGSYSHWWDKTTGRYRLEGKNKEGQAFVILFNVQDRKGKAWLDGKPADAEQNAKLLEFGYGRFINDTYWFLMPLKMRDPGVRLQLEGERTDSSGKQWQVLHLSFDQGIGLTPGDQYWAFLDPVTHLMGRWEYVLQDEKPPATAWTWEDWRKFGPLTLSPVKKKEGGDITIRIANLAVSDTVDESAFREPS